jgi:signal transduction histidine kinase
VALGALVLGRRVMAPFRRVSQRAELLGRGERAPDVPVEGPKDVREIVSAFNAMNARVSQATDYQIGLLRSLGHDLKGPLASVGRLVSTVGPEETRAQIETRLGSVQSIVEAIMSFSRAVMRDGALETTDMAAMLHAVVDEQADLGADAVAEAPDRLLLSCRVNAMERCLRNLVENALKYGGAVEARLFAQGDEAVIQIDDRGPGIPEDEIESAFQPFYRLADDTV